MLKFKVLKDFSILQPTIVEAIYTYAEELLDEEYVELIKNLSTKIIHSFKKDEIYIQCRENKDGTAIYRNELTEDSAHILDIMLKALKNAKYIYILNEKEEVVNDSNDSQNRRTRRKPFKLRIL